ncbi:MAG: YezD family protein [Alicyclobacillaceae bacterium]|nr:YezD family protein [Alicyclobacillaceae bacterium]
MAKNIESHPLHPWLDRILEALEGLEYGTVQITVHDAQIVQIDRTEKRRFQPVPGTRGQIRSGSGSAPEKGSLSWDSDKGMARR